LPGGGGALCGERKHGGELRRLWLEAGGVGGQAKWARDEQPDQGRDAIRLLALAEEKDDLTLQAMPAILREERGVHAGIGSIWRFLAANRITLKKRR
jgi:transposase